ncbi:carotenoid cleavage dioxygenase [Sphingobium sp. B1D7B]|uniref:carotenoid oxygenase family protein n=1 Tax=unclassified Sphingobium TaxID=2611147 RepID=UPI002225375F|nr:MULTISPECIES: carotenoid oxygenase family protein [unclassified Sphingobium]MCW2390766.1 carotenoid cleavage dioxygenase [Sphingobium sp. B11D3A]MCW2405908.1 carotenoid cleavage dioxygenase [Sphingobium sp. B1D7B]
MPFPATPDYMGLNTPVRQEVSLKGLTASEGIIPADVRGAFFRAVPDPQFEPFFQPDTALSDDGMISRILFNEDGTVDYDIKYVQTPRWKAENAAGKRLFGRYRNPFTNDASAEGVEGTVSNTTPVWHAGKLIMTKEDGPGHQVDPHTLETIGAYDFGGALKSQTMTAHVRIDPETKEMFVYGYEADGLCSKTIAYWWTDKDGKLIREQSFEAPFCSLVHDFVITENYAIFPLQPTTADLERVKAKGAHWVHQQDLEYHIGVMPRYGDVSEIRWFKGPKGASSFHMMNAFETPDGKVHIDHHITDTIAFPHIRADSGIDVQPWELGGGFQRWTVDMKGDGDGVEVTPLGPPGDMPRIADADQGRPYKRGWYCSMNPQPMGPPLMGGVVGAMFTALLRKDFETGAIVGYNLPPAHGMSETVHVPSSEPGHEGWLVGVVDHETAPDQFEHAVWIWNAGDLPAGPVAKVPVPTRMRPQVHGWWVPMAAYQAAKAA